MTELSKPVAPFHNGTVLSVPVPVTVPVPAVVDAVILPEASVTKVPAP